MCGIVSINHHLIGGVKKEEAFARKLIRDVLPIIKV